MLAPAPQKLCMTRHLGKVEHPQNCCPAFDPDLTVRTSSELPHFGHCRSAVGSLRRLRFCTCLRWVASDGARRPVCRACSMASTSAALNTGCWNDLIWRIKPMPWVTLAGTSVLKVLPPTKVMTECRCSGLTPRVASRALRCL